MDHKKLIHQYLLGNLDEAGVSELDRAMAEDDQLRREFRLATHMDSALRESSIERSIDEMNVRKDSEDSSRRKYSSQNLWAIAACLTVAAALLLVFGWWTHQSESIATLASSENAAWESELPTNPGSDLTKGTLNLRTGLATIRFRSGAELTVEAPAQVELISPMRAKLFSGAAVMNVPESAVGFTLETPDGYAVDFGTKFAVRVDGQQRGADFELIEGEIEVHHVASGDSIRLKEAGTAATVSADSMAIVETDEGDADDAEIVARPTNIVRVATNGRCGTAMPRSHKRHKFINPEVLSVKKSDNGKWDFRSFFEFDVSDIDREQIATVRLRLNLVPSTRGVATRLPRINRFAIYGLTNPEKMGWDNEPSWEEAPGPEDGVLLGKFEIERSQQRGTFGIETKELLEFVQQRRDQPITLILVRETNQIEGIGVGLTHMFASDKHPEMVGPLLEIGVR